VGARVKQIRVSMSTQFRRLFMYSKSFWLRETNEKFLTC